jgi:hypothetical protein
VTRKRSRWKEIGRKFPENGIKLLLEDPRNVADLLPLTRDEVVGLIDFDLCIITGPMPTGCRFTS